MDGERDVRMGRQAVLHVTDAFGDDVELAEQLGAHLRMRPDGVAGALLSRSSSRTRVRAHLERCPPSRLTNWLTELEALAGARAGIRNYRRLTHFFFSALHFLGLSLVPVTVPFMFVAETTLPEKCAVDPFTVTLSVTSFDVMVPVTSAGPNMPW